MKDLEISDFVMLKAPSEQPDPQSFVELIIGSQKKEENMYGPVFTNRFIMHALKFIAKKFGEESPEDIQDLNQLAKYIISICEKHPRAYNAIIYAQAKTENDLQGQIGVGIRVAAMGFSRDAVKSSSVEGRVVDVDDAISKLHQYTVAMKVCPPEFGYRKNGDGSVDLLSPNCYAMDGCRQAFDEGVKRPDGRLNCGTSAFICQFLKLVSNYEWDYELKESYKPHCLVKLYMI
ncbi:MAG: hypothetical protein WED07_00630 [Candidatus Freyarchaeum deiterrae]